MKAGLSKISQGSNDKLKATKENYFNVSNQKKLEGTKNNWGSRHSMIGSMMDGDNIKDSIENYKRKSGKGYSSFTLDDPSAPIEIGGRLFYGNPNDGGRVTVLDGKIMNDIHDKDKERKAYYAKLIELGSSSREILAMMLRVSEDELQNIVGENRQPPGLNLPQEILEVSCDPDMLELLSPDSSYFSKSISKLRSIIMNSSIIVQNLTTDSVIENAGEQF